MQVEKSFLAPQEKWNGKNYFEKQGNVCIGRGCVKQNMGV